MGNCCAGGGEKKGGSAVSAPARTHTPTPPPPSPSPSPHPSQDAVPLSAQSDNSVVADPEEKTTPRGTLTVSRQSHVSSLSESAEQTQTQQPQHSPSGSASQTQTDVNTPSPSPRRTPPRTPAPQTAYSHSPDLTHPNPLDQAPTSNVLNDGNHNGIRFHTPVYICGGRGARALTVTDWGEAEKGPHPGYRVGDGSAHWHAADDTFPLNATYSVMQDNAHSLPHLYCSRQDDRFMMIVKPKLITISSGTNLAHLKVSVGHDHSMVIKEATQALHLPIDHYGLRCKETDHLFTTIQYRDLHHEGCYEVEGLKRRVFVYGDRRVVDWPRSAPLATRMVPIEVRSSSGPEGAIDRAAHMLLPKGFPAVLRNQLSITQFPNGFDAPQILREDTLLELRMPSKNITIVYEDLSKKVPIQPGWTTAQSMEHIITAFGLSGGHILRGAVPTWSFLREGVQYTLEQNDVSIAVQFDVAGGLTEGEVVATREEVIAKRVEVFHPEKAALSCQRVFGAEGGTFLESRAIWKEGDCVDVFYNDGSTDDGFYPAIIMAGGAVDYTVRFTESGEYSQGVLQQSLYNRIADPAKYRPTPRSTLIYLPPNKQISLRCAGHSDVVHTVDPGQSYEELVVAAKRVFAISFETVFDVRCELSGSFIATSNAFFGASAIWNAVADGGVYSLALRDKKVHVVFQGEAERAAHLVVKQHHRKEDILDNIKRTGQCGMGPGWSVSTETDPDTPVVLSYATLKEGATYLVREADKHITIQVDPRVLEPATVIKQDIVVCAQIKPAELWRVVIVHPTLCLQDIWARLHLPQTAWKAPSPNPSAVCDLCGLVEMCFWGFFGIIRYCGGRESGRVGLYFQQKGGGLSDEMCAREAHTSSGGNPRS